MSALPNSLPRVSNFGRFREEPIDFLARARRRHGDLFVLRDSEPVFSRAVDCAGAIAVFGTAFQKAVLGDIVTFGMPDSAASRAGLPGNLVNLNRSLHSMPPDQHDVQKRLLTGILARDRVEKSHGLVLAGLEECTQNWMPGVRIGLLEEIREIMFQAASRVLFGDRHPGSGRLASRLQSYFHLRREVLGSARRAGAEPREQLVALGNAADGALREFIRECRREPGTEGGILGRLATLEASPGKTLSEDEVAGHFNILFISSTEPMAIALTWILLILTQLPELRAGLREELAATIGEGRLPETVHLGELNLLDRVISETLRLLPPNAFMVRITEQAASLGGVGIPARTEIVLCPSIAHRDAGAFPRPDEFLPGRWKKESPSPYAYFPFGAGGHACVGRNAAIYLIKTTLAFLLPRWDLVLADDQEIDWRIHIMFMPTPDPTVTIGRPDASAGRRGGRIGGPIGKLVNFEAFNVNEA